MSPSRRRTRRQESRLARAQAQAQTQLAANGTRQSYTLKDFIFAKSVDCTLLVELTVAIEDLSHSCKPSFNSNFVTIVGEDGASDAREEVPVDGDGDAPALRRTDTNMTTAPLTDEEFKRLQQEIGQGGRYLPEQTHHSHNSSFPRVRECL